MKNKERGRGTVVQSLSVPLRMAGLIEEVSETAAKDGLSFSSLVVKLLEDYNQEKNGEARTDLSAISQSRNLGNRYEMGVNEDLRSYLDRIRLINDVQELREINLTGQEITKITGNKLGQLLKKDDNTSNRLLSFSYDREQLRASIQTTER
jgi:hypothetical protein